MKYWIITDDIQQGPFSIEQLRGMNLHPGTPVWHEGLDDWMPAHTIVGFEDVIRQPSLPVENPPVVTEPRLQSAVTPVPEPETVPDPVVATPDPVVVDPVATIVVPIDAIPSGYVPVAPAGGVVSCPPSYLVWAIITTIVCFLPLGVCAIICAVKVGNHYKAGRLAKAYRMSERAALFVILSIVAWLVWMPFSIVFAML